MLLVAAEMSMSLDGFVADPDDRADELANTSGLITGRRTFDIARGVDGTHLLGVPVVAAPVSRSRASGEPGSHSSSPADAAGWNAVDSMPAGHRRSFARRETDRM